MGPSRNIHLHPPPDPARGHTSTPPPHDYFIFQCRGGADTTTTTPPVHGARDKLGSEGTTYLELTSKHTDGMFCACSVECPAEKLKCTLQHWRLKVNSTPVACMVSRCPTWSGRATVSYCGNFRSPSRYISGTISCVGTQHLHRTIPWYDIVF